MASNNESIELTVVVPTYNEVENIGPLIDSLIEILERDGPPTFEILVVDDNSPDGTCLVVRERAVKDRRVRCLLRKRGRGLATAIMRGIARARGKYVIVMDADFQHPPEVVPKLYRKAVEDGADVVVATRYAPGGGVVNWSRSRILMSKTAGTIARILVPAVKRTSDPMSGFFLVRKDSIDLTRLNSRGYKILMEILAKHPHLKVSEVPYVFRNRRMGSSKLGAKTIADFLIHAISLSPMVKFAAVGLLGALLNLLVMNISLLIGLPLDAASLLGIETSLLFNFVLHEQWTFGTNMRGKWLDRLIGYHGASAGGIIATYGVMKSLVVLGLAGPIAGQAVGIIAGFGVNYTLSLTKVWGSRADKQRRRIHEDSRRNKTLH